jgi:hypothetical protein
MKKGNTLQYFIIILLAYFIYVHHYLGVIYVDSIIVAAIVILLSFLINKTNSRFFLDKNNLIIIAIILWLLFGVIYSNAPIYGLTKLYKFTGFYLLAYFTAETITRNISFFLKVMAVFLLIMILDIFYVYKSFNGFISLVSVTSRLEEFGVKSGFTSPIEAARYIAFIIILIFISFKEKIFNKLWRLISYGLIIFGLIFMVLMGSKGPFLSMFLAISFLTIFYSENRIKTVFFFIIPIFLILIIYIFQDYILAKIPDNLSEYIFYRYFNIEKFTDRPDLFMMALNDLNNYFIGEGTGNFGFILFGFDANGYPHNIFVELFYENGIIGLILFLSLLFSTLWRSIHINNRIERVLFTVSILFFLFASMTSGDIAGNPFLFIFIVYANYCYLNSYIRTNF